MLRTACSPPRRKVSTNVANFMLCSFAHHACSPLLQGFLHEELCTVALPRHFSLDVIFICQDSALELESRVELVLNVAASFLTVQS